ncbi:MAG TPA: VWA domain-containing protein [Solirubrobacteraceae bacterium]|nr:VWA domain-containing protein [Solirubrobacteraceae bacterium]
MSPERDLAPERREPRDWRAAPDARCARDGDELEGLPARILELGEELRREGVPVGTSEILDAFEVLGEISWTSQSDFREALAATLAKSQEDRRIFELVFERFFFRAVELAASRQGIREDELDSPATLGELSEEELEELRMRIAAAVRDGSDGAMRDLARMAIAAFARRQEGSGVIGVDVQRIRRALGLRAEPQPELAAEDPRREGLPRESLRRFEALLRRELERSQIERTGNLPPSRPLGELDRALPSGPLADLAAVHRVVAQLRRRLATQGMQARGHRRHAHVDVRRTMRASLQTGGVPVVLKFRPRRPKRPEIYVLCDVSTSVTSASVFFLSVLHALHDTFRKMRSFVFIERISEVTDIFERERDFKAVSERISSDAGVADISGYTDYGRVWSEFLAQVEDELHPRATVIVLGDARTNGRDPRADVFAQIAARAGRTFWLNPEPRLYWNYGDSVIAAYEQHCTAFECWTTAQLEDFVRALTRPVVSAAG